MYLIIVLDDAEAAWMVGIKHIWGLLIAKKKKQPKVGFELESLHADMRLPKYVFSVYLMTLHN